MEILAIFLSISAKNIYLNHNIYGYICHVKTGTIYFL